MARIYPIISQYAEQSKDDFSLAMGSSEDNGDDTGIIMSSEDRFGNLLVLGTKNTGKTTKILVDLFAQDLSRNCGITIFATSKEISYTLYTLAQQFKRNIVFVKPSLSKRAMDNLINTSEYDYTEITQNVVNFKKAIRDKSVVIIDLENFAYQDLSAKAGLYLLDLFQKSCSAVSETSRTPHFLYIDDAFLYSEGLLNLLRNCSDFNVGVTLFAQAGFQFGTHQEDIQINAKSRLFLSKYMTCDYMDESGHFKKYSSIGENRFIFESGEGAKTGLISNAMDVIREKHATQIKRNKTNLEKNRIPDEFVRANIEVKNRTLFEALGIETQVFDLTPEPNTQSSITRKDLPDLC